jgi:hypothetical protein
MEVLQIQRSRESCCLVLVFGLSSSPVLPPVRALLDYVWTTVPGSFHRNPATAADEGCVTDDVWSVEENHPAAELITSLEALAAASG